MAHLFMQDTPLAFIERQMMAIPGFGARREKEDETPCRRSNTDRSIEDYHFPSGDGCFIGKLVMKKWNRKGGLNCYFDTADSETLMLCAWNDPVVGEGYCPEYTDIDMSMLPIGTTVKATFRENRSGKSKWLEAEILKTTS